MNELDFRLTMDDELLYYLAERRLVTEPPVRDSWRRLSVYESASLVERQLADRHGPRNRGASAPLHAFEISSHVVQGRQYFEAASGSAALIRPLLIYYGVLALSRAMILFSAPNGREATLHQGHGVGCLNWGNELAAGLDRLPALQLRLQRGTFNELTVATKNVERSTVQQDYNLRYSIVQEGTTMLDGITELLTLKQLLTRLPDLNDLYQVAFRELGASHVAYVRVHPGLQTDFHVLQTQLGLVSWEHLCQEVGLHPDLRHEVTDSMYPVQDVTQLHFIINRNNSPAEMVDFLPPIRNDLRGLVYLVEPLPGRMIFSTLSLLFLVSFALGMLVRYHPPSWAALLGRQSGDSMLPLLNAAASLIEKRFPELALQELEYRP